MAPWLSLQGINSEKQKRHCFYGHDYYACGHWKCYTCKKWFDNSTAHGCSRPAKNETITQKEKEFNFLLNKRNEEIKRVWKRDQYVKIKGTKKKRMNKK